MTVDSVCFLPIERSGGEDTVKDDLSDEIHSRWKLKETKKAVAGGLRLDVWTVCRVLRQEASQAYERVRKGSRLLGDVEDCIRQRATAVGFYATAIYEALRARGYRGGHDVVRRFVSPLRTDAALEAMMMLLISVQ
jgi:transposase